MVRAGNGVETTSEDSSGDGGGQGRELEGDVGDGWGEASGGCCFCEDG